MSFLKPRKAQKERKQYSWKDWDSDAIIYDGDKKSTGGFSDFWRGRFMSSDSDEVLTVTGEERPQAFLKHLRAIRNTCRIIFNKSVTVNWATQDFSVTDITNGIILISPRFLKEHSVEYKDWSLSRRLDACHGAALHEGAHNRWTPADSMIIARNTGGEMLAQMFNIIEDGYIESEVENELPGFAGYIDSLWDFYLTPQEIERRIFDVANNDMTLIDDPQTEDEKRKVFTQVNAFVNLMIAALKSRNEVNLEDVYVKSDRHADLMEGLEKIRDIYRRCETPGLEFEDRYDYTKRAYRILCNLFRNVESEDISPTAFFMNEMPEELRKMFRDSGIGEAQGTTIPAGAEPGASGEMSSDPKEKEGSTIAPSTASTLNGMLEADLRSVDVENYHTGSRGALESKAHIVDMRRKKYADEIYRTLRAEARRNEQRMKNALKFRGIDKEYTERERPHGKIDPSRLHNLRKFGSRDIYMRKITTSAPKAHIGVLVDESGSMGECVDWASRKTKAQHAIQAAIMLHGGIAQNKSLSYEFWGHTGDIHGGNEPIESAREEHGSPVPGATFRGPLLMRYLDSLQGLTDPHVLGRITSRAQNYDGYAIEVVSKHMAENAKTADRKVMFIICDGMPAGSGYYGIDSIQHTVDQVNKSRKRGVEVIAIYVGQLDSAEDQMVRMYGQENKGWFRCVNSADLPATMERMAARLLHWEG